MSCNSRMLIVFCMTSLEINMAGVVLGHVHQGFQFAGLLQPDVKQHHSAAIERERWSQKVATASLKGKMDGRRKFGQHEGQATTGVVEDC